MYLVLVTFIRLLSISPFISLLHNHLYNPSRSLYNFKIADLTFVSLMLRSTSSEQFNLKVYCINNIAYIYQKQYDCNTELCVNPIVSVA